MKTIRKNLRNKIMLDYKIDLIYQPYFILLKIRKLDLQLKNSKRKTQVVNIYKN